jgi:SAM-dependent methyltransferase
MRGMDEAAALAKVAAMTETPSASDWAAARGEKWRDQLSALEAMLAPIDQPLIAALALDAPCRIADIGCGGGGTTLELSRRAPVGSSVHGYDISPALIETARTRVPSGQSGIDFLIADMSAAPAPDGGYDRLTSRFGIMFYDDQPAAFANLANWLTPCGRFAFAVWGPPADNPWMTSLREAAVRVIDVPPPDPDAPGPFRYGGGDKLRALLEGAGFGGIELEDWRGQLPIGGGLPVPEAVDFALRAFSFGDLLAEAGDAAFGEARRLLTERFARHERDGAVWMDARAHIVTGGTS